MYTRVSRLLALETSRRIRPFFSMFARTLVTVAGSTIQASESSRWMQPSLRVRYSSTRGCPGLSPMECQSGPVSLRNATLLLEKTAWNI